MLILSASPRKSDSSAWSVLIAAKVRYGGGVSDEWNILQETEGAHYDQLKGLILPKYMELCIA